MSENTKGSDRDSRKIQLPTVGKLLSSIHDHDARVGLVLSVFLLFISSFVWFGATYGSAFGGVEGLTKFFVTFLVLAVAFVLFFKAVDGSIIPRVIVWYFSALILLTVTAFWFQAILRTPTPILIDARCFVDIWSQGCPLGKPVADVVEPAPASRSNLSSEKSTGAATRPDVRNRVFVQFSGALSRDDVRKVSLELQGGGWNVQGADRGGERTAQAVGIDQVRYFHKEDADLARSLAATYNAIAKWSEFDQLDVAYVGGYASRVPVGQLEVWTSVE